MSLNVLVFVAAVSAGAAEIHAQESRAPTVRDVTPPWMTRVVPSGRAVDSGQAQPVSLRKLDPMQVMRVTSDGALVGLGLRVRIAGVIMPVAGQLCTRGWGERWACGSRALIAWANLARTGEVRCDMTDGTLPETTTSCEIDGIDAARWLVERGWAAGLEPGVPETLVTLFREAQAAGRGLWADDSVLMPPPGLPPIARP